MKLKATTLSVILKGETTVSCGVTVGDHYTKLTLRFDRGDEAILCGYPMSWGVHDTNINYYDHESPTWSEMVAADGVDEDGQPYISAETEAEILKKIKRSVQRQFRDPMWVNHCDDDTRKSVLNKITQAVKSLESK